MEFSWKFLVKETNNIICSLKDHAGFCVKNNNIDYKEVRLETGHLEMTAIVQVRDGGGLI